MEIKILQKMVDSWIEQHGGYWEEYELLARITEEAGEVAAALQRKNGLRPRQTETNLELELGDLLFIIAAFANKLNIDLEESIQKVFLKYNERDGKAWKLTT